MDSKERIKIAFDRNAKALSLRPTLGTGTAVTRVRLREGLTCDIEDGEWKLTADMGEKSGGNNQGPNAGVLGRGALGSCLAMSYAQWAAQLGVPVAGVEVEIQADYDGGIQPATDAPARGARRGAEGITMDARLQRRVQRYGWDKAADYYEGYWSRQLAPAQARLLELAALAPGEGVLDVACGTGLVTIPATHAVGPGGEVVGTDISDSMVNRVREAAAERGVDGATFARMDAEDLQFPDASFDAVLCALGLMYFPDPLKALTESHRVLKPGGRAVAAVWGARDACGWAEIFPIVDSRVRSEVCPMFFQLGTGNLLEKTFGAAGFMGITADRLSTILRYDSAEAACGAAFAGGPVALAYSRFDEQTREDAHATTSRPSSHIETAQGLLFPASSSSCAVSSGRSPTLRPPAVNFRITGAEGPSKIPHQAHGSVDRQSGGR